MKRLYEFTIAKEELVKESETTKNDSGEEITTTKEIKKSIDKKYFMRKPTRRLFDEAELFYGVRLAEGIKAGLLTKALLQKRFNNDGGTLADDEREEWGELYSSLFDKQVELQALSIKTKEERSAEENAKYENLKEWMKDARLRIQEFEMQQSSLYDQTAENRARNKTILWWVLHLAYWVDEGDEEKQFFGDGSYEDRVLIYDRMEEQEEDYVIECINKFFYYVSFWYVSKTSDPEQFKDLIKFAEQEDLNPEEPTEVSLEDEEASEEVGEEAVEEPVEDQPDNKDIPEEETGETDDNNDSADEQ